MQQTNNSDESGRLASVSSGHRGSQRLACSGPLFRCIALVSYLLFVDSQGPAHHSSIAVVHVYCVQCSRRGVDEPLTVLVRAHVRIVDASFFSVPSHRPSAGGCRLDAPLWSYPDQYSIPLIP